VSAVAPPFARRLPIDAPWGWLAGAWLDLTRAPLVSLTYGAAVAAVGWALTAAVLYWQSLALALPLAAGFMLVAPMLAVGLYETSRRLEAGEPLRLRDVLFVATRSPVQLGFMGLVLALFFMAWQRLAMLFFALFFGTRPIPPLADWIHMLFFTPEGLLFLALGSAVGGALAAAVFALSAISVPMLMAERTDAVSAMATSVRAVLANPKPMLLWAWLLALLMGFGLVTLYVGLIVTFPLAGYATWRAYRELASGPSSNRMR
jgi:uncharacterized membrane protein